MSTPRDLAGNRYGSLVAIEIAQRRPTKWKCACDCGSFSNVETSKLTTGHTKSCGCRRGEVGRRNFTTHGLSKTPEFRIWHAIKQRCGNPNNPSFEWYGARGIKLCERWQAFENFYNDMAPRPSPRHTIERHDVDGDYSPGNCTWVDDAALQAFNQNRKSNNTSGHSGVYWRKDRKRWIAKIFIGGKHRIVGSFTNKSDAIACRKAAEVKYYGREKKDGLGRVLSGAGKIRVDEK